MNSTLIFFSKTNPSPHDFISQHLASNQLLLDPCGFFYIKKPKFHIDQRSKENGWIWWENENPSFKNFSKVTVLDLALREDEESPWLIEIFLDVSLDFKVDGKKLRYRSLKILVDSKIRVLVSQLVEFKLSKLGFSHEFLLN